MGNKYTELVELANDLDQQGLSKEADQLDSVLAKVAATSDEHALSGKAKSALQSLLRTLTSFNGKNLDARGAKRRTMSKIIDDAEDLANNIKDFLGEKS